MSRMTIFVALWAGASWAVFCDNATAERKADPSQLSVGSHCELATKDVISKKRRSWREYLGTVQRITDESVTLIDVSVTDHVDNSTPVLRTIPYVNRWFKNVGVGRIHLGDEAAVVRLKDIAWNETVDEETFRQRTAIARESVSKRKPGLPITGH